MYPSRFRENKCLVSCNSCEYVSYAFRNGYFVILAFGWSEYQDCFWCGGCYFHVKGINFFHAVRFDLINFIFNYCFKLQFGCFILTPTLLLALMFSTHSSKAVEILEILLFCSTIFNEILLLVSFCTLVPSQSHISLFTILFKYSFCLLNI